MRCSRVWVAILLSVPGIAGCGGIGGGSGGSSAAAAASTPWQSQDIGAVGLAGSTTLSGASFQIAASGGDIWDAADGFRFVYKPLNGDGEIVARVASLDPMDAWAKAGVMIRETLTADSAFAMSIVTPANGACLQFRASAGAGPGMDPTSPGTTPLWVRITRAGNTFTGSISTDGAAWISLGSVSIPMSANAYIGLCVTAHNNSVLTHATIDSVGVTGSGGPPPLVFGNLQPVSFDQVTLADNFWAPRIEKNRTTGLPVLYQSFVDNHNLDNFAKAAGLMGGNHDGFLWADSDVYKTLEGMARAIRLHPDANLESKLEAVITNIAAAQLSSGPLSGYLDTYFQLGNAGRGDGGTTVTTQPWEDLKGMHEDYCHGHLIEAALEHQRATGRTNFLGVARKLADHLESVFGVGKRSGVPGHQEAEIALMKLWALQGKQSDLDLAKFYIDERGRHSGGRGIFGEYCQDLAPLRTMTEPQGHGVRGPYLWSGATDVAAATNDPALVTALEAIWQNIVDKKMFVTGGTGMREYNEGYAPDYDLDPGQAYNETCSGCATMMFSARLANLKADGKYMDLLERILYNTFAAGHSLDVSRFYYNNFMTRTATKGRMGIACCATNTVRVLPSIGGWQYATRDGDGIWTHLYMAGQAQVSLDGMTVGLKQETSYPWDGSIKITLSVPSAAAFTLHLRIPAWAAGATATAGGAAVSMGGVVAGYLPITRTWQNGDVLQLALPMPVRRVYSHPKVVTHQGRVAIARGPIVYCLESSDNSTPVHKIVIPSGAALSASYDGALLGGVTKITGSGLNADTNGSTGFTMIPYGVWDNRSYDSSLMTVMIPETVGAAVAQADKNRVGNATVSYSYKNASDTETAVNDGLFGDPSHPRFTWWSHQGTQEWIQYDLPAAITVGRSDILWYEDASQGGGCDYPQSFSHEYWNGSSWQPLQLAHDYMNMIDLYGGHFTILRFVPVTTTKVRLKVTLKPGKSGGIREWRLPE
ncbi:MAG: glycoside hydrolase family 127 protein [Planctomycetes bacterium]|nr:glycoside hydrolase family 127 protein [Planctomycetota bacterium]